MKPVKQEPINLLTLIAFPFAVAGAFFFGAVIGTVLLVLGILDDRTGDNK